MFFHVSEEHSVDSDFLSSLVKNSGYRSLSKWSSDSSYSARSRHSLSVALKSSEGRRRWTRCCQGLGCLTVGSEINDCAAAVWCLSTFKSSQDVIFCPIYAILPLNDTGQMKALQLLKQTRNGGPECTFKKSLFYQVTQQKLNERVTWFAYKQPLCVDCVAVWQCG